MHTLENSELTVSVLDPVADEARLGSRYCSGGYIYQVTDVVKGNLLSGPQYPDPEPDVFDGQGAPDMFMLALGAENVPVGGEVGCIGVGRVRRTSPIEPFSVRHNPDVIEYLQWAINQNSNSITMETEHAFQDWAYRLIRQVALSGRMVHSRTEIHSLGRAELPLRWFPHPFFPLTDDDVLCRFSIPVSLPDNPGFWLNDEGYVCRKPDYNWPKGCFQALEYEPTSQGATILQRHATTGQVITIIDYEPSFLPIWGNDCTFSFEPYLERRLEPGQSTAWSVNYQF